MMTTGFRNFLLSASLLFFGLGDPGAIWAETPAQEFAEANRAYAAGKYDQAIAGYERLLREHGLDASVLFNLGNAYFEKDELGLAILSYERALKLSPRDPDVLANLKVAREEAGLDLQQPRWWQEMIASLTPNQWAYSASALLFGFTALTLVYWFRPGVLGFLGLGSQGLVRLWRLALFLVFVAFAWTATCGALSLIERNQAVVVAKDVPVLLSPFAKAKKMSTLAEGDTVTVDKIDRQYGDFVRVRYGKRQLGWVSREKVRAVDPNLW